MRKYAWLVIVLLALVVAPLAAVQAADKVNLVLWHAKQDAEGDGLLAIIAAFQKANPDITIEQVYNPSGTIENSFIAAAGSGQGPDMIIWANNNSGPWSESKLILDLTDSISKDLKAQVVDSAWGNFTYGGKIYGVPFSAKTLSFFYNKSLVPDAPATWADALKAAKDVAKGGKTGMVFQNGFFHSAGILYSLGGRLMDDKGNAAFKDGDGLKAMEAYLKFHQDMYKLSQDKASGVQIAGDSPVPGFQAGDVGMIYDGVWNLAQYEKDLGDNLGVATMPKLDNGKVPGLFAQSEGFYANANLKDNKAKLDAFLKWASYVTGPDAQQVVADKLALIPVNPKTAVKDANLKTFQDQFALGTPFPNQAEMNSFWGPMGDAITAVSAGGETPEAAAKKAYDTIQKSIDDTHAKAKKS